MAQLNELRVLRREVKLLERDLRERQAVAGGGMATGRALLAEGVQVGLIRSAPEVSTVPQLRRALAALTDWVPETFPEEGDLRAPALREEIVELRSELRRIVETKQAAKAFAGYAFGYANEVTQQSTRMESIGVLGNPLDQDLCPFCGKESNTDSPTLAALTKRLESLREQLSSVEEQRPRLLEYINELEGKAVSVMQLIREKQQELANLEAEDARAQEISDRNSRIARMLGRVSLYLESQPIEEDSAPIQQELNEKRAKVSRLEDQLENDESRGTLESIVNRIGVDMTKLASELPFEHAEYPLRFDLRNLTVVADRPRRPFPMQRMGSAQNWLVCHLAALLALHRHFRMEDRPVPGFLVLDQPSQVYFPSVLAYRDVGGTIEETTTSGADLEAVNKMFKLIFSVCENLGGSFQVIVLEHANLDDARFQQSLIEAPWDGDSTALVPPSWINL